MSEASEDRGQRTEGGDLWVCELGIVEYREALALQERLRDARLRDELPDVLLLLEHPPVYTRGRRSQPGELPMGEEWYRAQGIDVVETDRGGRLTYHGPGQLVGYAVMRVDDVVAHVRTMERAIVAALAEQGVEARVRTDEGPDFTGVWVEDRKVASIGVHVSRGITTHGFAINIENDLQPFEWVVPCGLAGVRMTSLSREVRAPGPGLMPGFRARMAERFCAAHGRRPRAVTPEALGAAAAAGVA